MITQERAWKVKRIRNTYNAVIRRYWWHAWWFVAHSLIRGGIDKVHIGLEVNAAQPAV